MPGIFGVVDLEGAATRSAERLDITRRMAAAMRYEADYVTDIVASPALGACAGRVGWLYEGRARSGARPPFGNVLLAAGEGASTATRSATVDDGCYPIGAGAQDLAREFTRGGIAALAEMEGAYAGFF